MTPEQIAELERLEREANEWCGPTWEAMNAPDPDLRYEAWLRTPMRNDGSATLVAVDMAPENARLAAAMRNALPSLLSAARDLAALRAAVEALAGEFRKESTYLGAKISYQGAAVEVLTSCADRLQALLPGGDDAHNSKETER